MYADEIDWGDDWTEFVIPTSAKLDDVDAPFEERLREENEQARRDNIERQKVRNVSVEARARLSRPKQNNKFNRARRGWR